MPADPYTLDLAAYRMQRDLDGGNVAFDQVEDTATALSEYRDFVRNEGRQPFSRVFERRASEGQRLANLYLHPQTALSPDQASQLEEMTAQSMNAEADRASYFNATHFAHRYWTSQEDASSKYELYRADYARKEMGRETATDTEVFEHIKGRYEFDELMFDAARASALTGTDATADYLKFIKSQEGNASVDAKAIEQNRARFAAVRESITDELAPWQGIIDGTLEDMRRLFGTSKAKGEDTDAGLWQMMERIRDLPKDRRPAVLQAISDLAEMDGIDPKGVLKKIGESLARGTEQAAASTEEGLLNFRRNIGAHAAGGTAQLDSWMFYLGRSPKIGDANIQDGYDIYNILKQIGEQKVDPVKGKNWLSRNAYQALESLPYTIEAAIPVVGTFAAMQAMAADNLRQIRLNNPELSGEQSWAYAQTTALPQAIMERFEAAFLLGKMPTTANLLNRAVTNNAKGLMMRGGIRWTEATAGEMVSENVQQALPQLVTDLGRAMDADAPGFNFERSLKQLSEQFEGVNQLDLLVQVALLSTIGAGVGTWRDVKGSRQLLSNEALIRPFVDSDAQASEIRALSLKGDMDGAAKMFNSLAKPKLKEGLTFDKAARQAIATMQEHEAKRALARETLASFEVEAPTIERTDGGWKLRFNDGSASPQYTNHAEADAARWAHTFDTRGLKPVELMRRIFARSEQAQMKPGDTWTRKFDLMPLDTRDKERMSKEGLGDKEQQMKRRAEQSKALMEGKTAEQEFTEASAAVAAVSETATDALAGQWILGTNKVQFQDGVRNIVTKMFAGGDNVAPLTALEEDAETEAKTILQNGGADWMRAALREYEKVTGDKLFRTADDAALKPDDLVEAFSHMAVAVFAGNAVGGKPGSREGLASPSFRNQLRAMFGLRVGGAVNAMAQKWQAAFRRAAAIQRASKEGKLSDDLRLAIAKAAGLSDQETHERDVATEAARLASDVTASILSHEHGSSDRNATGAQGAAGGHGAQAGDVRHGGSLQGGSGGLPSSHRPLAPDEPLRGLTGKAATVTIPGKGAVTFGPHQPAREAAERYARSAGLPYDPPQTYAKVDKDRATRIAGAFEAMPHDPANPEVRASYDAMIRETLAQWEAIKATGLVVEPITPEMADPYAATPRLAILDVVTNNHLWFFPTNQGFGGSATADVDISGNPLLLPVGETLNGMPLVANDVFRIVHDYFGHIKEGVGFRADGEENAWRSHSAMYSPLARKAMTTETRGQNSWVNFGPYAEHNATANGGQTQYAPQKIGLLPDWTVSDGASDPVESETTMALGPIDKQLAAMFQPFQQSPDLRRKLGIEMQRRAVDVGRKWDAAAVELANLLKEHSARTAAAEHDIKQIRANQNWRAGQALAQQAAEFDAIQAAADTMNQQEAANVADAEQELADAQAALELEIAGARTEDASAAEIDRLRRQGGKAVQRANNRLAKAKASQARTAAQQAAKIEATRAKHVATREAQAERDRTELAKKESAIMSSVEAGIDSDLANNSRERLLASIRTLDAITAALPPEVAHKVGGMAPLAEIATDEKKLEWIAERVKRIDKHLEKYLQKELREEIEDLFNKSRAKKASGDTPAGKLGADTHAMLEVAELASRMTDTEVAGKVADLDAQIASGTLTPEQEAVAITTRELVQLVGDMYPRSAPTGNLDKNGKPIHHRIHEGATAARLDAALEALEMVRGMGYMEWTLTIIARREARERARQALTADTGKTGLRIERDIKREEMSAIGGTLVDTMIALSSFAEQMRFAFGEDSTTARGIIDRERAAANQKEDAMQLLSDEVDDFFTAIAGGTTKGERLRWDLSQISIRTPRANLSQLEAIQALLMWRQEDGQRHMIGHLDDNGRPMGPWNYDQAWIDEVTKQLTPEARAVMKFIQDRYATEYDQLNTLYRERHGVNLPRNNSYSPLTLQPVQSGGGNMVDPISGAVISGTSFTPGSLRTRSTSAVAEPKFLDALQTLIAHKSQMEHWAAYYDLATDAKAILAQREIANAIEAAGGEKLRKSLKDRVEYFALGGVRDSSLQLETSQLLNKMTGRAATMALFGRVSTLLIQSTQLAASMVKMPLPAFISRFSRLFRGKLGWGDAFRSDFIQRRLQQKPPIVRQAMEGLARASKPNEIKHWANYLGTLLSGTDALFTSGTYAILLDYHRENGRKLGMAGQDLEEWAHTEAARDTEDVAQPTRAGTRSMAELTATHPLARLPWSFASESRQKLMMAAWALYSAKAHPARAAKTAFLTFIVGGLVTHVIKNAWKWARGEEDEEAWTPERLIKATLTAPLNGLPGADALMGNDNIFSRVSRAPGALKSLGGMVLDGDLDGEQVWKDAKNLLWATGMFNDTAAAIMALANAGEEPAKILSNAFGDE